MYIFLVICLHEFFTLNKTEIIYLSEKYRIVSIKFVLYCVDCIDIKRNKNSKLFKKKTIFRGTVTEVKICRKKVLCTNNFLITHKVLNKSLMARMKKKEI